MTLGERKNALPLQLFGLSNIGAQTYTYNGLGDRVRVDKPTGARRFVYDSQGRVLAEYGGSAAEVKAEFIWALPPGANDPGSGAGAGTPFGGGDGVAGYAPLALVAQNAVGLPELYWVHGNHLGVPQVTTNAAGQVTNPGDDFLRPGFPGQSQVLTDLYYNRARDYDPVLGRYIQADPIGLMGGANPYLYAGADPVNMVDPLGLEKYNLFPFEEPLMQQAADRQYQRLPINVRNGWNHFFGHSSANVFCVYARTGPTCLTPKQFVIWMQTNHVNPNLPIKLWSCSAGAGDNSFAENLSLLLDGRMVVAATEKTLWRPSRGFVGMKNQGRWVRFGGGE